jgi:putative SOS response-associated peptidase YedK
MCNLISMTGRRECVLSLFRVSDNRAGAVVEQRAIFPGHEAAVVRPTVDGERELVRMSWGFVLPQPGKAARRVTNFRDDKAFTRFWRPALEARPCLVPASSFCEPDSNTPAGWHWFALKGDEARPLFAFPGIWQHWIGPVKRDGPVVEMDTFSILTTEPNDLTRSINHERSPVLLAGEDEQEAWLSGTTQEAFALARPFPAERMQIVQSGKDREDLFAEAV